MRCYGFYHIKKGDWKSAIECFTQAIEHLEEDTASHFSALHQIIYCLINFKKKAKAKELLEQAQSIYGEHEVYSIYFTAQEHYLTIFGRKTLPNKAETEYILTVAIPHFKKMCDYFIALEYYDLLEEHFTKVGNNKVAAQMSVAIRKVYERCFLNMKGDKST